MSPSSVTYENSKDIQNRLYTPKRKSVKCSYSVGDIVRMDILKIPNYKKLFKKGYEIRRLL